MNTQSEFPNLKVVNHPLIAHKLTRMREVSCLVPEFRKLISDISYLMLFPLTQNLAMTTREIQTPFDKMNAPTLAEKEPILVPILRAGEGMMEPLISMMPNATIYHVGVYRDKETHLPQEYLNKLPEKLPQDRRIIVVDPLLATGHSALHTIELILARGGRAENISMLSVLSVPEGVQLLLEKQPKVQVFTSAMDSHLNETAYMVPGIGDAGDRIYGT
ncbi:MAG TPA: uracil phosphoribosyltransferase [Alphaproteobacteria bacterium]|nr:uracil phosphoribosyltransferase [Alphaproteobacteria bacterium]